MLLELLKIFNKLNKYSVRQQVWDGEFIECVLGFLQPLYLNKMSLMDCYTP